MRHLFISLIGLLTFLNNQDAHAACADLFLKIGPYHYRQVELAKRCFTYIHPDNTNGLIYRDFLVGNTGEFMIWNSFGQGQSSTHTGSRVFMFFPRQRATGFHFNDGAVAVFTANPDVNIYFSAENEGIVMASGAQVIEDRKVTPKNNGGVEILIEKGLLLDAGFKMGGDPRTRDGHSLFKDRQGQICSVKNTEIFSWNESDDVHFQMDDTELKIYLQRICPSLILW